MLLRWRILIGLMLKMHWQRGGNISLLKAVRDEIGVLEGEVFKVSCGESHKIENNMLYTQDTHGNWFKSPYVLADIVFGNETLLSKGSDRLGK